MPSAARPRLARSLPPMTPEIVRRQVVAEEHDLAPDGRWAVIVRRAVAGDRYVSHLWLVPLDGGRPRPLTSGAVRDSRPRVSPDGRRIAFRRSDVGDAKPAQRLMVIELDGEPAGGAVGEPAAGAIGEPWTLTPGPARVGELAWAPDGRRLAFTAEAPEPRFLIGREVTGRAPLGRRIRRIDWRHDESGHVDRWDHLFVVPAREGARARRLTRGDFGVAGIAWRPDGRAIAFATDRGPEPDLRPRTTIWAVPARGGEPVELIALGGSASAPAYSPDGRWLAAIGVAQRDALDDVSPGLVVAPWDGSAPAVALAPELDRPVGNWVDTDLNGWMAAGRFGPAWTAADQIVAIVSDRGRSVPWRFPVDPATGRAAGAPEPLVRADAACVTLGVTVAVADPIRGRGRRGRQTRGGRGDRPARRQSVSVVGTLGGRANELMTIEGSGPSARLRTRTTLGSAWQRRVRQPEMRCLQAPGPGGPIETWVASPPGAGDAALPTVVDVHGGPLGAWAPAPSLEVALLVSRGYRVVLPNIRGSATYGRDWIRPQLGDWGGVDAADVHATLDEVVRLGLADPARVGVLGLSYGGFMVHWLIGTSDRFRAAVSENGVANQVNAWANSDTGVEYNRVALLGDPLSREGMERLWRQSPLAHVSEVRTPLLMFQAEADERCPKADNEQFFTALRVLRREVEYVLYPEEYHVYATTGRPDRRVDRMTRMLDWFDRFLKA